MSGGVRDLETEGGQVLALPPLEESVEERVRDRTAAWFVCPSGWALRHQFINRETGEVKPMRCGRWDCRHCGPRKVVTWGRLIEAVQPELFVTLTKAGRTLVEASRALTTFLQALRRGSKRAGRPAYAVEYLAVPEWHSNGWLHWHVLVKGVDFLPHEVLSELWRSATRGRRQGVEAEEREAYVVYVERVRSTRVVSYVTKYLLKVAGCWQRRVRRVRYSRRFFGEAGRQVLLRWLLGQEAEQEQGQEGGQEVAKEQEEDGGQEGQRSGGSRWLLWEQVPGRALVRSTSYGLLLRERLRRQVERFRRGELRLSRRVLSIWERWRVEEEGA
jgi:hypothetical protein